MKDRPIQHNWLRFKLGLVCCFSILLLGCSSEQQPASVDQLVSEMSQRIESITLKQAENGIVPRFNQSKTVACVNASFQVHKDIPASLKQGLFAQPASYPALLRFANASEQDDSEKDIRGLSMRLSNVQGETLWGESGKQDFLLNSYPALFVATPEDFLSFIRARQDGKEWLFFLDPFDLHLKSLWTVIKARKKHSSPLNIRYWSTVPFALGEQGDVAVKYSVTPCPKSKTSPASQSGPNQLRSAIKAHLQQGAACFNFGLQRQSDEQSMPIEDASVIWDEDVSPFQTVATIRFEKQDFDNPAALARCELSQFNPWQSLAAHKPLGKMNEVRRKVYQHAAKLRIKE